MSLLMPNLDPNYAYQNLSSTVFASISFAYLSDGSIVTAITDIFKISVMSVRSESLYYVAKVTAITDASKI